MKSSGERAPIERWLAVAIVAALAANGVWVLRGICADVQGLPLYDEAGQSFAGVRLARSLRTLAPIDFLHELNGMVTWPFVHPLLLTPCFLVFGDGFGVPEVLSRWLWAGTAVAACFVGLRLHAAHGAWVGLAAGILVLLSPLYRVFATVGTLEIPGAFLLAVTVACHVRAIGDHARIGWLRAAGWTTTALFLCKYNYGGLWLVPFAAHEWWMLDVATRRRLVGQARSWWTSGAWRSPMPLLVLVLVALLVVVAVTGGFDVRVLGQRISVHSLGNPAYALLVVLFLWAIVPWRRRRAQWRALWQRLPQRHRTRIATIVLPLLVWFLIPYPNRVKAFFGFVTNKASGAAPWTMDWLLDYPRVFVSEYSPVPTAGWLVLGLALVPPRFGGDAGRAARLVHWAAVFGLVATMLHHYHAPRFLFTTAVLLWLSAARTAVEWLSVATAQLGTRIARIAWVAGAAACVAWTIAALPAADRTGAERAGMRVPMPMAAVATTIVELAARSPDPILLGYSNALSPGLVQWQGQILAGGGIGPPPPEDWPWLAKGTPESALDARVEALRRTARPVIAALPAAGASVATAWHRDEVWADSAIVARLERRSDVERTERREIASAGFVVSRFVWRDAAAH